MKLTFSYRHQVTLIYISPNFGFALSATKGGPTRAKDGLGWADIAEISQFRNATLCLTTRVVAAIHARFNIGILIGCRQPTKSFNRIAHCRPCCLPVIRFWRVTHRGQRCRWTREPAILEWGAHDEEVCDTIF